MFRFLALALILAAPLDAQLTPKQAVFQLKAGAKDELKLLKAEIKLAHEDFVNALENTESYYEIGTITWQDAVYGSFAASQQLQLTLHTALIDSVYTVLSGDCKSALGGLGVGGDAFPLDFYFGQGGALDDVLHDLRSAVEKELTAASKRLKKTAKRLETKDDVVMLFSVRLPDLNDHYTVNEDDCFTWGAEAIAVHTTFAASQREVQGDGVVCLAGRGYTGTVSLSFGGGSDFSGEAEIDSQTKSWSYMSEAPVAEGNYILGASIEADTSSALLNVGVP